MDWLSSPIAEEKGDVIGSSVKERLQAGRMTMRRIKKVDLSGNDLTCELVWARGKRTHVANC